jgi:hypothetical protein
MIDTKINSNADLQPDSSKLLNNHNRHRESSSLCRMESEDMEIYSGRETTDDQDLTERAEF